MAKMNYEDLKEQSKSNFGNRCYTSNVDGDNLICFSMCEVAQNDISAEILRFNGDSDTFIIKFTETKTGRENTKEYSSVNDFISDFKDILNLTNETERIYNNIFCK